MNAWFSIPFDITSLDFKSLPYIENMMKNVQVTPFLQNEFLYFGFNYFTDPVQKNLKSFNNINNDMLLEHAEKFFMIFDMLADYYNSPAQEVSVTT